jgi:hypothetical protein
MWGSSWILLWCKASASLGLQGPFVFDIVLPALHEMWVLPVSLLEYFSCQHQPALAKMILLAWTAILWRILEWNWRRLESPWKRLIFPKYSIHTPAYQALLELEWLPPLKINIRIDKLLESGNVGDALLNLMQWFISNQDDIDSSFQRLASGEIWS